MMTAPSRRSESPRAEARSADRPQRLARRQPPPTDHLELLRPRLALLGRLPTATDVAVQMRQLGLPTSNTAVSETVAALRRETTGAGILDDLINDPEVTDVLVNGPDEVWVDRGRGLVRVDIRFESDAAVRELAAKFASRVGRRLDDGCPYVDARLPGGTRIHAVLAGIAAPGTCLSLRVPSRRRLTLEDWVRGGALPAAGAELLRLLVHARLAFIVSGGTGSGKTTLLSTLLGLVRPDERIVIVEDSKELAPDHPHWVGLEARPANVEGRGAITLDVLVRQALRMRPDRLVVGEVRGAELADLLAALNTGHEGGCGTVHANSAADIMARLEALAALGGMTPRALHAQVASALRVVIQLNRRDGVRQVEGIHVLTRREDRVHVQAALTFEAGRMVRGPGLAQLEDWVSR